MSSCLNSSPAHLVLSTKPVSADEQLPEQLLDVDVVFSGRLQIRGVGHGRRDPRLGLLALHLALGFKVNLVAHHHHRDVAGLWLGWVRLGEVRLGEVRC